MLIRVPLFLTGAFAVLLGAVWILLKASVFRSPRTELSTWISPQRIYPELPGEIEIGDGPTEKTRAIIQYSLDHRLQTQMEQLFKQYNPDHGAFVALDPSSGRILAILSHSQDRELAREFVVRATYPAASVFKVVTASAAIAARNFSASSVIPFNGSNHTLYRRNVLKDEQNRWTRNMTLREAFGRSVNTVFGKIGAFFVGREILQDYANRFGFNRTISRDLNVERGIAMIPSDTWGLAEAASGFTREITMSPLQGALIAAAVANDGLMMEPFLVHSLMNEQGETLYRNEPHVLSQVMDGATAFQVRELMRATVQEGTSRKSFRGFERTRNVRVTEFGGKTGSLTGLNPRGKYDWFIGYAMDGNKKIALCALTVHAEYWRVKSSYLARRAFEVFLKEPVSAASNGHVVKNHSSM